ncbi:MAG: TetR/AcrR family transcriptional regulator [Acidimicrobiales bacterium]
MDRGTAAAPDNEPQPTAGPPARPQRRQQAKADKRARILHAARTLFNERGFEATTTAAITEAAGIGAGTLFLYVASKHDLLVQVFRQELQVLWDDAFDAVNDNDPLTERIISLFGHVIADHELNPSLSRAFVKEVMFVGELERDSVSEFMEGWSKRLTNVLREAQAQGELSTRVRATTLGVNLYALFFYLLQCRYGGYLKPADLMSRLREGVDLQLRPWMT